MIIENESNYFLTNKQTAEPKLSGKNGLILIL